ncbi:MAG: AbiV family abortive infection protein [Candidatus Bathyarchaeia archaeon]
MSAAKEKEILERAMNLCLENVERYIKDAELLITNSSYGHAYSLLILAEEELTKATIYYLGALGVIEPKFFKKVLLKHSSKHWLQAGIHVGIRLSIETFLEELGDFLLTGKSEKKAISKMLSLKKLEEAVVKAPEKEAALIVEAMEKERKRLKGFYVDVDLDRKSVWSPKSISKKDAENYLSTVKSRYSIIKLGSNVRLSESEVKRYKMIFDKWLNKLPSLIKKVKPKMSKFTGRVCNFN